MNGAPAVRVPLRGEWRLVYFLSQATGGAAWWFAEQPSPPPADNEIAIVEWRVGEELNRLQREWREAQDRRRRECGPRLSPGLRVVR